MVPSYGNILTAARLKGLHMEADPNQIHSKSLDAASKPKSGKRKWWRAIGIVCLGLLVFILAIPTILGTRWIYEPLIKRLAMDEFDLNIESVQLGWFSQLEFKGISIAQSSNSKSVRPLVSIRSIQSNRGLMGYLLNGRNLGRLEIVEPKIDIALLEDGSNLERLFKSIEGAQTPKAKPKSQPKLDLDLAVRSLSVQIEPMGGSRAIQVIPPMNADISYRALNDDAHLIIQPMQVLDQTELTPELVRLGVGLAVPLLAKSAWFDGRVSLKTKEIRVPLAKPIDSRGQATLTLHQVRSGPSEPLIVGALDALANLRGKETSHEIVFVDGSQVAIQIADGKVFHSGLEAGLPKLDQRLQIATQGYVGFVDRSLDLSVEIPIPIEQLARREKIQQLGVPRVKLPIGGTLDAPEIKWEVMRGESALLLSVIAGKLQTDAPFTSTIIDAIGDVTEGKADEAIATAVDFVRNLRKRRAQENENEPKDIPPPKETDEPELRRPIRDALKKILKRE